MSSVYTVVVQDQTFRLSNAQIEFDSPNFFTSRAFDPAESSRSWIELSRDPQLFKLIVQYLCGYTILPIPKSLLPEHMAPENAITNLRVDAEFYGLNRLKEIIDAYERAQAEKDNPTFNKGHPAEHIDKSPCFHFPGRVSNWTNWDRWAHYPAGYMEFPLSIDLSKSFTITCWYKARSKAGWHTLISIDAPSAPHPLLYISISPAGDFRFEVGVDDNPDRFSSEPSVPVGLNVWSHLAFTQHVNKDGSVGRRILYIDGTEIASTHSSPAIYNPAPSQTRMAIMRGAWDHHRTAGFLGQAENIAVFERVMDQSEIVTCASRSQAPADHGWPLSGQATNLY